MPAVAMAVVIRRLTRRNSVSLCPDGVNLGNLPGGKNSLCQNARNVRMADLGSCATHLLAVVQALEVILPREFASEHAHCGQCQPSRSWPGAIWRDIVRALLLGRIARLGHALAEIYEEAVAAADSTP